MILPFEPPLNSLADARVRLVWKALEPVRADTGIGMLPDTTLAECPPLDVVCVPGGPGVAGHASSRDRGEPMKLRNSRRVSGLFRKAPSMRLVVMVTPDL